MMNRPAQSLSWRLARRELRRRPWRTALVVLLVALPTAATMFALIAVRTQDVDEARRLLDSYGTADLEITTGTSPFITALGDYATDPTLLPGPPEDGADRTMSPAELDRTLAALLPDRSSFVTEVRRSEAAEHRTNRATFMISDLPIEDPITRYRFAELSGRTPTDAEEVVLTTELADRLGIRIGDEIHALGLGRPLTVVGTVVARSDPRTQEAFVAPGTLEPGNSAQTIRWIHLGIGYDPEAAASAGAALSAAIPELSFSEDLRSWVVTPGSGPQVRVLRAWSDDDSDAGWLVRALGGIALACAGIVISAAFAVGASRQLRELGLLSAAGASPAMLRRTMTTQGALVGLAGAGLGLALAVTAAIAIGAPRWSRLFGRFVEGPDILPTDLAVLAALAVLAGVVAARGPAKRAARIPTLAALAGRAPQRRVPAKLAVVGWTGIAVGGLLAAGAVTVGRWSPDRRSDEVLTTVLALGGGVCVLAGVCALSPWAVGLVQRSASAGPASYRLAARSLGRNRARSGSVVAAICALATVCLGTTTIVASFSDDASADQRRSYSSLPEGTVLITGPTPNAGEAVEAVRDLLDGAEMLPVDKVVWVDAAIATPEWLDHFDVPDEARQALRGGGALEISAARWLSLESSEPVSELYTPQSNFTPPPASLRPAGVWSTPKASELLPRWWIDPATAESSGFELAVEHSQTLADAGRPLTSADHRRINHLRTDLNWENTVRAVQGVEDPRQPKVVIAVSEPPSTPTSAQVIRALLVGITALLILAVTAVGLALAAKDGEDERAVLDAVGAAPSTLRRIAALRATLLVGLAMVLAVPAALVPAWLISANTVTGRSSSSLWFQPDWTTLALLMALPVVAGGLTWVLGTATAPLRRSLAFDS